MNRGCVLILDLELRNNLFSNIENFTGNIHRRYLGDPRSDNIRGLGPPNII